jgi:mannose-1-phosphate guanylyltransferase
MSERFVVIMAGGRGERFWPASRLHEPKHLLPIVGDTPMLNQTIARVQAVVPAQNILVITTQAQGPVVKSLCPELPLENIITEPAGRDTAAATGLATLLVKRRNPKATFAMLPADHVIKEAAEYQALLRVAFATAEASDVLVTLGIKPTEPSTGFGYIQRGEVWQKIDGREVLHVKRFVEKPRLDVAQGYLASGDYYWNAGMFIWRVPVIEQAFREFSPELHAGLKRIEDALTAGEDISLTLRRLYASLVKISIDYAVMEKARNVVLVPATFDWDDVGSWPAVVRHNPQDKDGNVQRGAAVVEQGRDNIVMSLPDHLVAVVGLDNVIVVHTEDATLVCSKEKAQEIKNLLKRLETDPEKKKFI